MIAVFVALIVTTINRFSVWIDESATLELVGPNGYGQILARVQYDSHPPLWYLVLKPWLQVFGTNIIAARSQSAVFMLAAFGVWYHFVRTRFSRPLALLVLALMVTNPMLLHYAVEGRMYAFAVLLTAFSCVLLTSTWKRRWIAYWLCALVMLYTHYFLSFVVAAEFVFLLLRRREMARSVRWILIYGASIVAVFAPWLPRAVHISSSVVTHGFWIPPVTPSTVSSYVLHTFLHRLDADLTSWPLFPGLVYLVAWGAALLRAGRSRGEAYALLWAIAGVPWLFLLALSCKPLVPVFHPRYVIFGLPALITLLATGARLIHGRLGAVVIAMLVLGNLAGVRLLRDRGFNDTRGYWAMKSIARDIAKPIDGELPYVVSAWLFPFLDARATLGDEQRVVQLRDHKPSAKTIPDALYYDRPDWYVMSLSEISARHVWFIEEATAPVHDVPANWTLIITHRRGYARYRLFTVTAP